MNQSTSAVNASSFPSGVTISAVAATFPTLNPEASSSTGAQSLPALTSESIISADVTPEAADTSSSTLDTTKFRTNLLRNLKYKYNIQLYETVSLHLEELDLSSDLLLNWAADATIEDLLKDPEVVLNNK